MTHWKFSGGAGLTIGVAHGLVNWWMMKRSHEVGDSQAFLHASVSDYGCDAHCTT
jgi:hypothetical protein